MQRFDSLEGLRAPLAWWVVISHLLQHAAVRPREISESFSWLYFGLLPVYGFMILSGFVIAHLIIQKREPYPQYIFRRFMRLAPLLIVAILFAYLLTFFSIRSLWPNEQLASKLLAEISLFHGLVPEEAYRRGSMQFSPQAWSISLEWQFYMVAPLIVWATIRGKYWTLFPIGLLVLSALSGSISDYHTFNLFGVSATFVKPSHLLAGLPYFLVGMSIYLARLGKIREAWLIIPSSLLILLAVRGPMWWVPFMGIVITYLAFSAGDLVSRIFELRPMRFLGTISYSTYLLHMPIIKIIHDRTKVLFDDNWEHFWVLSAVSIPLIFLVSVLGYFLVEKPAIKLAAKITDAKAGKMEVQTAP